MAGKTSTHVQYVFLMVLTNHENYPRPQMKSPETRKADYTPKLFLKIYLLLLSDVLKSDIQKRDKQKDLLSTDALPMCPQRPKLS